MSSSRRQYPFHLIEPKWQKIWDEQQVFRAFNPGDSVPEGHPFGIRHGLSGKVADRKLLPEKFYILDMFPYPSGAGLHVGHPEGYTATDILARYKRAQGFNVLHPMGWDAFGLPAEQYAVKTGQHPRQTTDENIATFKRQIQSLGFSYDWSREIATTNPDYFKWTQWIFLKLYNSYFDPSKVNRDGSRGGAESIVLLEDALSETPKLKSQWENNNYLNSLRNVTRGMSDISIREHFIETRRLAYIAKAEFWWCEALGTVLANEEVVDGKSEVGGFPAVKRPMDQWVLRISAYAERLHKDLETIDWSESVKQMQRNWIGRSEGAKVSFRLDYLNQPFLVFTTRPDTLFGATYMVLAPEHKRIDQLIALATNQPRVNDQIKSANVTVLDSAGNPTGILPIADALNRAKAGGTDLIEVDSSMRPPLCVMQDFGVFPAWQQGITKQVDAVRRYREEVARKTDLERTDLAKEKTGVFTGAYAINPVNGGKIPIWIADYVLSAYGTGAIMAVPAHDERDFEFATKFNLPIVQVVQPPDSKTDWRGFIGDGVSVNSTGRKISITGLPTAEAKKKVVQWLESEKIGSDWTNYRLRDWLFSRQRYWGEPFPIVWKIGPDGESYHEALPESSLPVLPPTLEDYKPTATGEPPLARAKDWVNLPDGSVRETNTMPQWAGSCWYYLRYLDAKNNSAFVGKDAENYWMASNNKSAGVDLYVGGTEHAVLHLLYARFWHKVLFDLGYVSTPEPFFKLVNQGMVLGEDNQKMSKSRGNVIPVDMPVAEVGTDALRLYEMFMGPLEMVKPWSTKGVEGVYRFLGRVWRLFVDEKSETAFEEAETTATESQKQKEMLDLILLDGAITDVAATSAQLKTLHACIKKVTEDLDAMRFNTAISAMMVFINEAMTWQNKPFVVMKTFLQLLAPFAPHLAEELWSRLHSTFGQVAPSLTYELWPKFDPALLVESEIEIPIQREGKTKVVKSVSVKADKAEIEKIATNAEEMLPHLEDRAIQRVIVQPGRFVNLVTKPIGHIAEKIVQEYFTNQGIEIEIQPPNTRHDITIPASGSFVEVKSSIEADLNKIRPIYLSAAQFEEAKQAGSSGHPFELHFITGVNPETGAFQNHYKISSDFIMKEAKPTASRNGWVLPVSGAFEQFKM